MIRYSSIQATGDQAITICFGDRMNPAVHEEVMLAYRKLRACPPFGFVEAVPGYTTLLVIYNPCVIYRNWIMGLGHASREDSVYAYFRGLVEQILRMDDANAQAGESGQFVEIPVIYGGEDGPDLAVVAADCGLSEQQVIELHISRTYTVYMIGFLPGFPYMGDLPDELVLPRKATPGLQVPPGSVAIAGRQTGIYPYASPGGWWRIGRTSLSMFHPREEPANRLQVGDRVKFVAVESMDEARKLAGDCG